MRVNIMRDRMRSSPAIGDNENINAVRKKRSFTFANTNRYAEQMRIVG